MPISRSNDVVAINGIRINKQGVANIKDGITTEDAAKKTKRNGLDEMVVGFMGPDGKAQRKLIYGDNLDFSYRKNSTEPQITINGQEGVLIHFEDESNTFMEGALKGIGDGFRDAFNAVASMAQKSVAGVAMASGAAFLTGTVFVMATKGAGMSMITSAFALLGPPVAMTAGVVSLTGVALIVLAGIVKGGFGSWKKEIAMDTIAGVIDEVPNRPAAPQAPVTPRPVTPAPAVTPAANNRAAAPRMSVK